MKALNAVFFAAVAVIALSFVMTIYCGVRDHRAKQVQIESLGSVPKPAF